MLNPGLGGVRVVTSAIISNNRLNNNNKKFRSFKSKENIHKKEVGPYHGLGY